MGTLSACDMPEARRTAQAECVTVCPRRRRPVKESYGQKAECAGATTRQDAHIAEYRLFRQVEAPAWNGTKQTAVDRAQPSVPWSGGRTAAQTSYLNFG